MGSKSTFTVSLLVVAMVASCLLSAQAYVIDEIAKPSVPEFSVQVVSHPYDVPPKTTTTVDQYTGKETTNTIPGYRVENKSIEITIKNQPFTSYNLSQYTVNYRDRDDFSRIRESATINQSKTVNFYYNIEVKGHYGDSWVPIGTKYATFEGPEPNAQLGSAYTVISVENSYPEDSVLDFRVQARIGYFYAYGPGIQILGYDFYGQESEWSSIQTLTFDNPATPTPAPTPTLSPTQITTSTPTATDNPTATPTQPETATSEFKLTWEQTALAVAIVIIVALMAALVLSRRKKA